MAEKRAAALHPFDEVQESAAETRPFDVHAELVTVYKGRLDAVSSDDANRRIGELVKAGTVDELEVVETRIRQTAANEVVADRQDHPVAEQQAAPPAK